MTVTLKQVDTVCCGENDKEVHDVMSVSVLVVILYNLNHLIFFLVESFEKTS